MTRRWLPLLLLIAFIAGCAGPEKLAERSQDKLARGDVWRAWELATRALDKAPANPQARAAAAAAAASIAEDWQRRIHATAALDSLAAAGQVMEFVGFRAGAIRYTTVAVDEEWAREEQALRSCAARTHYRDGHEALRSSRPKRAHAHFLEAERFVPGYRDAARLADRAWQKGLTRVAVVPLRSAARKGVTGREVADSWRGDLAGHLTPPRSVFTRVLPLEDVERQVRVSQLDRLGRDDAVALARKAGAGRVVWGSIGEVDSHSGIQFFTESVHRRVSVRENGATTTRWVEVPITVIARTRTVDVDLEYEIIATGGGATLARRHDTRTMKARVIWTAFTPEGAPDTYSLVSESMRASDPDRCRQVETRWKAVVGEGTTLAQVLEAKRASLKQPSDAGQAVARLLAGAAFVMLEDLPSTEQLALGALAGAWRPVAEDLLRLDGVDDVDLGSASAIVPER